MFRDLEPIGASPQCRKLLKWTRSLKSGDLEVTLMVLPNRFLWNPVAFCLGWRSHILPNSLLPKNHCTRRHPKQVSFPLPLAFPPSSLHHQHPNKWFPTYMWQHMKGSRCAAGVWNTTAAEKLFQVLILGLRFASRGRGRICSRNKATKPGYTIFTWI